MEFMNQNPVSTQKSEACRIKIRPFPFSSFILFSPTNGGRSPIYKRPKICCLNICQAQCFPTQKELQKNLPLFSPKKKERKIKIIRNERERVEQWNLSSWGWSSNGRQACFHVIALCVLFCSERKLSLSLDWKRSVVGTRFFSFRVLGERRTRELWELFRPIPVL